jgi:hypothetical protein
MDAKASRLSKKYVPEPDYRIQLSKYFNIFFPHKLERRNTDSAYGKPQEKSQEKYAVG